MTRFQLRRVVDVHNSERERKNGSIVYSIAVFRGIYELEICKLSFPLTTILQKHKICSCTQKMLIRKNENNRCR